MLKPSRNLTASISLDMTPETDVVTHFVVGKDNDLILSTLSWIYRESASNGGPTHGQHHRKSNSQPVNSLLPNSTQGLARCWNLCTLTLLFTNTLRHIAEQQ